MKEEMWILEKDINKPIDKTRHIKIDQ